MEPGVSIRAARKSLKSSFRYRMGKGLSAIRVVDACVGLIKHRAREAYPSTEVEYRQHLLGGTPGFLTYACDRHDRKDPSNVAP